LGFVSDGDVEKFNRYRAIEIKHGRVAQLAALDYFIKTPSGIRLPGSLGDTPISDIPVGLGAIKAVPILGWAQILLFASALEILAPQKEDKVSGSISSSSSSSEWAYGDHGWQWVVGCSMDHHHVIHHHS